MLNAIIRIYAYVISAYLVLVVTPKVACIEPLRYQVEKDELGLSCVNFNKLCCSSDPFVKPSQVHQVFYVPDPIQDGLHYVVNRVPSDLFDFEEENSENVGDLYWCEPTENRLECVAQTSEHDSELLRK